MWFQETEGAKFWMQVLNELKQRGVQDILICCVDGLKGFPEAIEAIFPQTSVQTCIVHLIRAAALRATATASRSPPTCRPIYTAVDADAALAALERFDDEWGARFPMITQAWLNALGARDAVPGASRRAAPRGLHDEHHRGAQPAAPQERSRPTDTSPTSRPPAS